MLDLVYVAGTAAFFALMLAYVRGCARLGGDAGAAPDAAAGAAPGAAPGGRP